MFILDFTRTLTYLEDEHGWEPEHTQAFIKFIDDLLRLGYKMQVAEFFREEADKVRRAHCEARLSVIRAKRK